MKNLLLILFTLVGLNSSGQSSAHTNEFFLGVKVQKHHTIIHPGDSVQLPANAFIMEVIMIEHGDYTVYSDNAPFIYPDVPGVDHFIHRNEGSFEIDGVIKVKTFDSNGSEKYTDQAIVSKKAGFHLYYFTLAEPVKLTWPDFSQIK